MSRYKYGCGVCGGSVTSTAQSVKNPDGGKEVRGLGTWRCRIHGKVAVKRHINKEE